MHPNKSPAAIANREAMSKRYMDTCQKLHGVKQKFRKERRVVILQPSPHSLLLSSFLPTPKS
jgi:hypothetical protein